MRTRDVLAWCVIGSAFIYIIIFVTWLIMTPNKPNVSNNDGSNQTHPTLAENGLYDHATTDFVVKRIQDNWNKIHKQSDDIIYYVDPTDTRNTLSINCYASLNALQDANNKDVDGLQTNGYQLADISYSGLNSRTYLLVQDSTTTTAFTATLRNCSILMFTQPYHFDGKDDLDAEVAYLQQINE